MVVHLAYLLYKLRNMEINHWTKREIKKTRNEQKCLFNLKFCVLWDLAPDHIVVFMHFMQAHSLNQRKRKLQPLFTIAYTAAIRSQYVYVRTYISSRKENAYALCSVCSVEFHVTFKTIIQLPNIFSRGSCIIVRLNQLFRIHHPFQQRYIIWNIL